MDKGWTKGWTHPDKGWTTAGIISSARADWPACTLRGVTESQHLAFHRLGCRFLHSTLLLKTNFISVTARDVLSLGWNKARNPLPPAFKVGRMKLLSSAGKEEPGSSELR